MKATTIYLFFAIFLILATSPVTSDTDTTDFEIAYTAWFTPADKVSEIINCSYYELSDAIATCSSDYFYSNPTGTKVRKFVLPKCLDEAPVWGYGTGRHGLISGDRLHLFIFFEPTSFVSGWYDLSDGKCTITDDDFVKFDSVDELDGKMNLIDYRSCKIAKDFRLYGFDSNEGTWVGIGSDLLASFSKYCKENNLSIDLLGSYDGRHMLAIYTNVEGSVYEIRCGNPVVCVYNTNSDTFDEFFTVEGEYGSGSNNDTFYKRDIPCADFTEALGVIVNGEEKPYWRVNGFNGDGWGYRFLYLNLIRPMSKDHSLIMNVRFGCHVDDKSNTSLYTVCFENGDEKGYEFIAQPNSLSGREDENSTGTETDCSMVKGALYTKSEDVYFIANDYLSNTGKLMKLTSDDELYCIDTCLTNTWSSSFVVSESSYVWYVSGKTDFVKSVAPESALHNEAFLIRYDPETETRLLILNPSESADPCVAITNLCPRVG